MLRGYNTEQGEAVRLYRMPEDIRRDMEEISAKIKDTACMLNIRNMLMEILAGSKNKPIRVVVMELEDLVSGTRDSLDALSEMRDTLKDLQAELEDARWAAGM